MCLIDGHGLSWPGAAWYRPLLDLSDVHVVLPPGSLRRVAGDAGAEAEDRGRDADGERKEDVDGGVGRSAGDGEGSGIQRAYKNQIGNPLHHTTHRGGGDWDG